MWLLIDEAKDLIPLPAVPWRDMTDDEFAAAAEAYAAQGFPAKALEKSGFFVYEPDPPPAESERR